MNQLVTIGASNAVFGANLNGALTMSSREIAELCEKQHRNVLRDIEKMLNDVGLRALKFEQTFPIPGPNGSTREGREYRLPKRLTVCLVTGYRADLRLKVIDRLEELEEKARQAAVSAFRIPQNYEEALEAHLQGIKEVRALTAEVTTLEAKVEEMVPAVEALERIAIARQSMTVRGAAKALQMTQSALVSYLITHLWVFRQRPKAPLEAYSDHLKTGHLEHKTVPYGFSGLATQVRITPKGLTLLAKKFGTTLEE